MTLIVSQRTLDGVVIAGDSLATYLHTAPSIEKTVEVECPGCKGKH